MLYGRSSAEKNQCSATPKRIVATRITISIMSVELNIKSIYSFQKCEYKKKVW